VRQRRKETYKLELTNKNYNYYKLLESGKQVYGKSLEQTFYGGLWVSRDSYQSTSASSLPVIRDWYISPIWGHSVKRGLAC
jgi:hypothetical protein